SRTNKDRIEFIDMVVGDLLAKKPQMLIVDSDLDYFKFFSQDKRFAEFLDRYAPVNKIAQFQIFKLKQ
ncbi:MAG: hypothetical protein HQK60_10615, partial [Deltaproteobacteria bacterium]|nr:hypothetical protein [Deltaproteobacteria bacterium]